MATTSKPNAHTVTKDPEKSVDVPPYGSRNPDPLTDQPGSHPVETGVGAVLGGVASGLAVGAVAGPVGAVIGAIAGGAAAGGLAGKGIGELIDPTTQDNWLREYSETSASTRADGTRFTADEYRPAYTYGMTSAADSGYAGRRFEDVEPELRTRYESDKSNQSMPWNSVSGAVRDAYDRTLKLHEERLKVNKTSESAGEARVRKEVHTEHQQVTVPVQREELVIERHAVNKTVSGDPIRAEDREVRIPLKEEKVTVGKETVLKEEVSVGKRTVTENKTVSADVRKEELVENETTRKAK
jgi:uncharacterized protein (TIGR02271 family)